MNSCTWSPRVSSMLNQSSLDWCHWMVAWFWHCSLRGERVSSNHSVWMAVGILKVHNSNAGCPHCGESKLVWLSFFGVGESSFGAKTVSNGLGNSGQFCGLVPCIWKADSLLYSCAQVDRHTHPKSFSRWVVCWKQSQNFLLIRQVLHLYKQ